MKLLEKLAKRKDRQVGKLGSKLKVVTKLVKDHDELFRDLIELGMSDNEHSEHIRLGMSLIKRRNRLEKQFFRRDRCLI